MKNSAVKTGGVATLIACVVLAWNRSGYAGTTVSATNHQVHGANAGWIGLSNALCGEGNCNS